ncbi:MAG TPA: COX15/CtaA family protein, partial [Gammaproteobacteria bacterium]|jgi:cytochrome c oxidase assembly protein subunit 15
MERLFTKLAQVGVVLTLVVVTLGAWVRLTDAGLGCPDWPGCYGRLIVSERIAADPDAAELLAERPLETGKAWREMIHRFAATGVGMLALALAALALVRRKQPGQPVVLPLILLPVVIMQGLLGMWTVTLKLYPPVVMAHLVGGLSVAALFFWLSRQNPRPVAGSSRLKLLGLAAAAALVVQIFLGGWTSANYAALACPDFPTCQKQLWPELADFGAGFDLTHPVGPDYEGGLLDHPARVAIHFVHRLGAIVATLLIGLLAWRLRVTADGRRAGSAIAVALAAQLGLGISIVVFGVPLSIAVAHNGVAALLLLTVINANQRIWQTS